MANAAISTSRITSSDSVIDANSASTSVRSRSTRSILASLDTSFSAS